LNINAVMQFIAVAFIPLIFAITLHEAAHGWVASKLGDSTALMLGRVTLNPAKHIDPIGTILLPIITLLLSGFMFGWAKPVPVNYHNLKKLRRDTFLVSIAGPASNLLMAVLWGGVAKLVTVFATANGGPTFKTVITFLHYTSQFGIFINSIFMVLNLLPIPPLDGGRILSALLPPSISHFYDKIEPFGIWILIALLAFGLLGLILLPLVQSTTLLISKMYGLTPFHLLPAQQPY